MDAQTLCQNVAGASSFENLNQPQVVTSDGDSSTGPELISIDLTQLSDKANSSLRDKPQQGLVSPYSESLTINEETSKDDSRAIFPFSLTPVRNQETQVYTDGKYTAAHMQMHMHPTSLPFLDTPDNGVLHVITGWKASTVLSDLCYRYASRGKWEANSCGFMADAFPIMKRRYRCNGVNVCPVMMKNIQNASHATENEWNVLQSIALTGERQVELMEMRKARNLFVTLTNPEAQFCPARWIVHRPADSLSIYALLGSASSMTSIGKCKGNPVIRQVRATGEWFVGCSDYYTHRQTQKGHFFHPLSTYTERARGYLRGMLSKNEPIVIPGDVCEYVAVKKGRIRKRCATHGVTLVQSGTASSDTGNCPAMMILTEPLTQNSSSSFTPVTFAMCVGAHNHPPPPQPLSTEKKMTQFRNIAESSPMTTASILKLQTQTALYDGTSSAMMNLQLSKNAMYGTLNGIRRKIQRNKTQQDEFKSLFEMVGRADLPYVRDARVLRQGVVFLLVSEKMLQHAIQSKFFVGDMTFKTVSEKDPHEVTPDWYLYNIVAPQDPTTATHKGVVVCRALCTSLSAEAYHAIWYMFLKSMREEKASQLGLSFTEVSIDVPYMAMEPARMNNSVPVHAITTDFEIAEIQGIASAFAEQRGGSDELHVSSLLVGCRIHFERAARRKAQKMNDEDAKQFVKACLSLHRAKSLDDADAHYAIIHSIDESWGNWLSKAQVRPLVSAPYSRMAKSDRMFAPDNTNIVESQNRRGNLICGTGLHPVTCALKLMQLDTVSSIGICMNDGISGQHIPRLRTRNGNTLAPSGSQRRPTGTVRGQKRKSCEGARKSPAKKSSSASGMRRDTDQQISNTEQRCQERENGNNSEALHWLHDELGNRCVAAHEEGNQDLLAAISDLYSYVIECGDLDKIKYRILGSLKNGGSDKEIVKAFTEILALTTKKKTSSVREGCVKEEQKLAEKVALKRDGDTPAIEVVQLD